MGAKTEGGLVTPAEAAVESAYGPAQPIEGLPEGFRFFSKGTDGGALFHGACDNVIGRFEEHADPALIVQAAEDHGCSRRSEGAGVG